MKRLAFLFPLLLLVACHPHSTEPAPPTTDSASLVCIGDFTEHPAAASLTASSLVCVGIPVRNDFVASDAEFRALADGSRSLYLVLEYTDTVSSSYCHRLPACWQAVPPGQPLADTVYAYTCRVLQSLATCHLPFVQLSRCIQNGFLWASDTDFLYPGRPLTDNPDGWHHQALYLNAAVRAVRETLPDAQIVLQVDRIGASESMCRQLTNTLAYWNQLGVEYDVLSLFFSPVQQGRLDQLSASLSALGLNGNALLSGPLSGRLHLAACYPAAPLPDQLGYLPESRCDYPFSPAGQTAFLEALRAMLPPAFTHLVYRYASSYDAFQLFDYQSFVSY